MGVIKIRNCRGFRDKETPCGECLRVKVDALTGYSQRPYDELFRELAEKGHCVEVIKEVNE